MGILKRKISAYHLVNEEQVKKGVIQMSSALVLIDMQEKFYRNFGKVSMDRAIGPLNDLISKFRETHAPVVWIQHESKQMNLAPGKEDFEIIQSLRPTPDEKRFVKRKGNGFLGTELQSYLNDNAIKEVYFCGYAAEACVNSTYNGGKSLGFVVFKVRGAIASASPFLLWLFGKVGKYKSQDEILA